jgi:hypothetical protein
MTLQNRTVIIQKDKTLSKITIPKLSIMWFFEWLKLALDYNGKTIEFIQPKEEGASKQKPNKKYKIKVVAWKEIDLKEIESMKPILSMTDKEKFNYLNKMFLKYKHLFSDFTLRYIKNSKDLIDDKNYFTVQIPISKNRIDIDNELEKLRTIHNIQKSDKTTRYSFHRAVKHKEMKRMFDVFKLKEEGKLSNEEIASKVKYKKGTYIMKGKTEQIQQGGVRQVQNAYASARKLIINIAKGYFPKNKL